MTPYERGYLAGQIAMRERAAKVCQQTKGYSFSKRRIDLCDEVKEQILSLQPEGADQMTASELSKIRAALKDSGNG